MSSVYVVCWIFLQTFQTYFCIQANSVDPDQSLIWVHTVCKNDFWNHKQTTIVVIGSLRVNTQPWYWKLLSVVCFFFLSTATMACTISITVLTLTIRTDRSKQCRPRSNAAKRGVWSGSTLFHTLPVVLVGHINTSWIAQRYVSRLSPLWPWFDSRLWHVTVQWSHIYGRWFSAGTPISSTTHEHEMPTSKTQTSAASRTRL